MGRARKWIMVSCFFVGIALQARGQDIFTLGFQAPDSITGPVASRQTIYCFSTLDHAGDGPGAQAWSIAVSVSGAEMVDATYAGTVTEHAEDDGFVEIEVCKIGP